MSEDPDSPSSEASSMPTSRGTGWHPQSLPQSPQPAPDPDRVLPDRNSVGQLDTAKRPQTIGTDAPPRKATLSRIIISLLLIGMILVCLVVMILSISSLSRSQSSGKLTMMLFIFISLVVIILTGVGLRRFWGTKSTSPNGGKSGPQQAARGERQFPFRGEVQGYNERLEQSGGSSPPKTVRSFRVNCYEGGKLISVIPVEMRGERFDGFINEGDTVVLSERWREGKVMRPKQIFNDTNRAVVKARGNTNVVSIILFVLIGLPVFLIVFIGLILPIISGLLGWAR